MKSMLYKENIIYFFTTFFLHFNHTVYCMLYGVCTIILTCEHKPPQDSVEKPAPPIHRVRHCHHHCMPHIIMDHDDRSVHYYFLYSCPCIFLSFTVAGDLCVWLQCKLTCIITFIVIYCLLLYYANIVRMI